MGLFTKWPFYPRQKRVDRAYDEAYSAMLKEHTPEVAEAYAMGVTIAAIACRAVYILSAMVVLPLTLVIGVLLGVWLW